MKLEIIAEVQGKSWTVGHTVLVDDVKAASKLIKDGVAIHHPTETNPAPVHECPCDNGEPCENCDDEVEVSKTIPSKKAPKKIKKNYLLNNK